MSRRNVTIASAAILTLAIAGCASEGTPQAANPSPTAAPAANTPTAQPSPAIQAFNNPIVAAKKQPQETSPVPLIGSNLIQPTNATERVVVVSKGRPDPFGEIVGVGSGLLSGVPNTIAKPVPRLPFLPTLKSVVAKGPQPTQVKPTGVNPATTKTTTTTKTNTTKSPSAKKPEAKPKPSLISVLPKVLPAVIPNPTLKPVLPPAAQPELAKAVLVSGVVVLGNQLQAIIKVPDEPTTRYVQPGQRLANGLLIKRIEMNEGDNPVVIVEQYGIEVARMVGEAPSATAPVANPASGATPPQNPVSTGAS